jgi:hypothetical protein
MVLCASGRAFFPRGPTSSEFQKSQAVTTILDHPELLEQPALKDIYFQLHWTWPPGRSLQPEVSPSFWIG